MLQIMSLEDGRLKVLISNGYHPQVVCGVSLSLKNKVSSQFWTVVMYKETSYAAGMHMARQ